MRIYVAGPYSAESPAEIDYNVMAADFAARDIAAKGHSPFVPHTQSCGWEQDARFCYDDFLRIDFEWLEVCDAILYLGPSPGADKELEYAGILGLTVFRSVEEVPECMIRDTVAKCMEQGNL